MSLPLSQPVPSSELRLKVAPQDRLRSGPLSYRKMIPLALAVALIVFAVSASLDWFVVHEWESRAAAIEFSDALGAAIAGVLSFRVLQYERERRRQIRQRLETIGNMNHHIRNALQVISGAAYSAADKEQLMAIRESVGRIEWALRELLPKM